MHALPAAPAPAPQRQILVGASLAVVAMVMLTAACSPSGRSSAARRSMRPAPGCRTAPPFPRCGPTCYPHRLRRDLRVRPVGGLEREAQRRPHTVLALGCTALVALLIINAQAFVYHVSATGLGVGNDALCSDVLCDHRHVHGADDHRSRLHRRGRLPATSVVAPAKQQILVSHADPLGTRCRRSSPPYGVLSLRHQVSD